LASRDVFERRVDDEPVAADGPRLVRREAPLGFVVRDVDRARDVAARGPATFIMRRSSV
jgi:hypothetical protein